jgi:SNF2 family DNA or RNA helicase
MNRHVFQNKFTYRRHHDKMRLVDMHEFNGLNVVLTTYHTVSSEWKAENGTRNSILFSVHWRRIVLDEGECIDQPT